MTAVTAVATALQSGADGRRLALVPYVGCHSPACFVNCDLESSVDWTNLRRGKDEPFEQTRTRLKEELLKTQLINTTQNMNNQRCNFAVIRATFMNHYHYFAKKNSLDFLEKLQELGSASSTMLRSQWKKLI